MPLFSFGSSGKSSHKYHCRVLLLDDSEITHEISSKTKGYELLDKVFMSLNLFERDYFGLRFRDIDDKTQWLDPDKAIKKQIDSGPPYTLYFGVKFYAADPTKLKEELTRYQFFLQIKKDILQGRLPCSPNVAAELFAYAVQSELGDYDDTLHIENYVSEFRMVPNQNEGLEQKTAEIHPKLRGQVPSEAEVNFLERVKWLEMYGVDLHPVRGQDNLEYYLGLTPTGIVLFRNRNKIGSFIWPKITKLKFKGHQFIIRVNQGKNDEEKEYTFSLETKAAAKQLWKYCAEHHTFFRLEKANDVPASAYNFLFKKGSGFRFSGRTQQELMEDNSRVKRPPPVVQRVQSKRYTRRPSAEENPGHHYRAGNRTSKPNDSRRSEPNGDVTTHTFYSVDGGETSPPWEQRSSKKSGLYTSGHNISANSTTASVMNESAPAGVPVTARFPRPHKSTTSLHSEVEMPKRSHYYSGYTSGASEGESVHKMKHRAGSEPNMAYMRGHQGHGSNNRNMMMQQQQHDSFHKQRPESRESVATSAYDGRGGRDYRHHPRESGSKSDGEQNSRQRRQQHYYRGHRSRSGLSDTEMVPALDVYRSSNGTAMVGNANGGPRHHHHKHHHHHHHQSRPRGPANFDPSNARVLLELGPDTAAPPESENSYGADSTISSIPEEKSATRQSHPANLNQSNASSNHSDQSNQMNHSHQMNGMNHPHHPHQMNHSHQNNHPHPMNHARQMNQSNPMIRSTNQFDPRLRNQNQRPDQYYRNHSQPNQRPVSADMKFVTAGYQYLEHGPRPVNTGPVMRNYYHPMPVDAGRGKMAGPYNTQHQYQHPPRQPPKENGIGRPGERNRYVQQYLPTNVVNQPRRKDEDSSNNNGTRQFVEQVVGPPSKSDSTPINKEIESELANYSISTEL